MMVAPDSPIGVQGSVPKATVRMPVLVFGAPAAKDLRALELAAERAATTLRVETSVRQAIAWLEKNRAHAVLVDASTADARLACLSVRSEPTLANVPIIGLVDKVTDAAFADLFVWGGDDLAIRSDAESLASRLRGIPELGASPFSRGRGIAVVADSDRTHRLLTGRVLRNAGYSVIFAVDAAETIAEAKREGVDLVVSSAALEEARGPALVARAREAGSSAAWLVAANLKEAARVRLLLGRTPRVSTYDASGPCENVLFVANELLRGEQTTNARTSARLLYGTSVQFREAGAENDEIGYSYNVSAGGLYVRTLVPPPRGTEVWLELRPPSSDRRVRLEGTIAWARSFGPNDAATVPPGFGFQVAGAGFAELERYVRSYRTYAAEIAGAWS